MTSRLFTSPSSCPSTFRSLSKPCNVFIRPSNKFRRAVRKRYSTPFSSSSSSMLQRPIMTIETTVRPSLLSSLSFLLQNRSLSSSSSSTPPPPSPPSPSLSPSSLNVLPAIPPNVLNSIRQLPEVEAALSSTVFSSPTDEKDSRRVLNDLDRARDVFARFRLPEEEGAVSLLQAQILHDEGRYDEAIETMMGGEEDKEEDKIKDEDKDERTLQHMWTVWSLRAKSYWYSGDFKSAEEAAATAYALFRRIEMGRGDETTSGENETAPAETTAGLRMGCSMNALALSKLGMLDIRDERIVGLYRDTDNGETDSGNDNDNVRSPAKILREAEEIEGMFGMASRVLMEDFRNLKEDKTNALIDGNTGADSTVAIRSALIGAASLCNQGVARLFYLSARYRLMQSSNLSTDSAVFLWTQGLELLDDLDGYLESISTKNGSDCNHMYTVTNATAKSIRARIYCNLAWTVLFYQTSVSPSDDNEGGDDARRKTVSTTTEDELNVASERAGGALKLYESLSADNTETATTMKPCLGRALGLVASCYARAGSPVTAEGLFQSAIDNCGGGDSTTTTTTTSSSPITKLDLRSCYLAYSDLCRAWEKREADAVKYTEEALRMDRSLSRVHSLQRASRMHRNGWDGKNGIYSGLCFFTIGDF